MLFSNPRKILSEAAAAELLNPEVSEEVKDVIQDLEDTLTNNVEEVKDADKVTNGQPITVPSVSMMESNTTYGRAKYFVTLEDVIAVRETEGEIAAQDAAAADAPVGEPGAAPTPEECEKAEPETGNIIERIADANGVDAEDVAITISQENVRFMAETALLEAKCDSPLRATRKLAKMNTVVQEAVKAGITLVKW